MYAIRSYYACDENNYCGAREELELWLWPVQSACHGIDDEAEEADKMAVDPDGNVYIIDDRYRVAKQGLSLEF